MAAAARGIVRAVGGNGPPTLLGVDEGAGVWAKLHRLVLDELGARGGLDWFRCAIDSVNMRALERGT